jgi:glyoxylase-like metal-dependent hydrolase (beta-lactamase superfamily II)
MSLNPQHQRIRIPLGERFADLWLFMGDRRHVLFDSGTRGTLTDAVVPALEVLGFGPETIEAVIISHLDVDHCGDAGNIRSVFPNAVTIAHEGDHQAISDWEIFSSQRGREFAEGWGLDESPEAMAWMRDVFIPGPVDKILTSEMAMILDDGRPLEVWHVPGHSHGHLAIRDVEFDVLAISDAILGGSVPLADGSPSFPPTYRHVAPYLATIARVRRQPPHTLLTAHYGDYIGAEVTAFLDESEAFVHAMDKVVRGAVTFAPKTLDDLVHEINPLVATWPTEGTYTALAFPVAGHLENLHASGQIKRTDGPRGWEWTL